MFVVRELELYYFYTISMD